MDDGDIPGEKRDESRRQDLKVKNNSEAQTKNLASLLILFFRFAYRETVIRIKADVDIGVLRIGGRPQGPARGKVPFT